MQIKKHKSENNDSFFDFKCRQFVARAFYLSFNKFYVFINKPRKSWDERGQNVNRTQNDREVTKVIVLPANTPVQYLNEIQKAYNDNLEIAMETIKGQKVILLIAPDENGLERLRKIFNYIHIMAEEVPIYR